MSRSKNSRRGRASSRAIRAQRTREIVPGPTAQACRATQAANDQIEDAGNLSPSWCECAQCRFWHDAETEDVCWCEREIWEAWQERKAS